jgi:LacI family transcriptional regulator
MSIKDIKNITGFSSSTISRVLSGKAKEFRISEKTSRMILEAAERVNYRPNILARSLRLRKTHSIGLIVSDIQNPYFGELASRIESLLREHGYSTFLCNTNEVPENEEFYLKILVDRQVDGIIIAPIHTREWEQLESLRNGTPIVLVDRIFYETKLPWVTSENTKGAEEITRELIKLGCRRIAFLGGKTETYINSVRYEGYANAMIKAFGGLDESLVLFKGYSVEAGEEMMEKLLGRRSDVEAVFCVNNLVFFGAVRVAHQFEARHGRTLMLAGFDIGKYRNLCTRPLISADQNLGELAGAAVRLLLSPITGPGSEDNHLIIPLSVNTFGLPGRADL